MALDIEKETLLQENFSNLPERIRSWIASLQVVQIIHDINENANIFTNARRSVIPDIIFRLVVKNLNPSAVIQTLASELQIKPEEATLLAEEIAERIFTPIKQTLKELGVDTDKIKPVNVIREEIKPMPVVRTAPPAPVMPPAGNPPTNIDELTGRYDAMKPENDKLMAAEVEDMLANLQKKKMELMPDTGGKKFTPRGATTVLPPPEKKINIGALPTLREEGDKIKLKEELSASAPSVAPFMLHKGSELPSVQSTKSFQSNIEAGYPRPASLPRVPVQIEIGNHKPTAEPARKAADSPAPPIFAPPPSRPTGQNIPDRAAKANEALRKPSLPVPPPTISKADPKIEGNTLDLRSNQ